MATLTDRSKWGIVFYGSTADPLPTYTDVRGQTQTAKQLTNGVKAFMDPAVASAYFHLGSATRVSFLVDVTKGSEPDDEVNVGLEGQFTGESPGWAGVATFRSDDQETKAVHTIEATGEYLLQTGNLGAVPTGRIAATPNISTPMTVIVYARAER